MRSAWIHTVDMGPCRPHGSKLTRIRFSTAIVGMVRLGYNRWKELGCVDLYMIIILQYNDIVVGRVRLGYVRLS